MTKQKRREKIQQTLLTLAGWVAPRRTGEFIAEAFLRPKRYARPEWEKLLLSKSVPIALPSGRKASRWGMSEHRVLLVHGWEGRGTQLGAFIEPLVAAGYQVIEWDGPAHGDSPGQSTHLSEFADALRTDIDHLGALHAVVAHSMGAASLMLAKERGLKIDKAVLIASPSQWIPAVHSVAQRLNLRKATLNAVLKSVEKRVGQPMELFDVQKWELKNPAPLLILHDDKDKDVPPSEFDRLLKAFPSARGKMYSGLGHRRILKDAGVISEVINFIKEAA